MKYLIAICFIFYHYCSYGQIRLENVHVSKCENEAQFLASGPTYNLVAINDSILQIQTRIISNLIRVNWIKLVWEMWLIKIYNEKDHHTSNSVTWID